MIRQTLLSSMIMLHSLTAFAQADGNGSDMGADPGLPAEAPPAPIPAPTQRNRNPSPSATLPAPMPEQPLVQPYDSPAVPSAPLPAPKGKPAVTGKLAELNLTPEQAQQIVELRRQWRPEVEKRLKEEFNVLKTNLAQAMADTSLGDDVRRRFELMQKKYLELQTVKFEKLLRIREVLTPEQRRKFAELRSRPTNGKPGNDND